MYLYSEFDSHYQFDNGGFDTPGSAQEMLGHDSHIYIADSSAGLQIVDNLDPYNQTLKASFDTPGSAMDIVIDLDYAYIADGESGVQVIDISTPSSPTFVAAYNTPGFANGIHIWNEIIFVADMTSLIMLRLASPTSTEENYDIPRRISVLQSYPNPFNASATISFELTKPSNVDLSIYNLIGQKIATLVNGHRDAGEYSIAWDAVNFSSGTYFARLETLTETRSLKLSLLK